MPHIAGLRGVLPEASKVAELANAPLDVAKGLPAGALARDVSRAVYRHHVAFAGPGRQLVRKSFIAAVRLSPWAEFIVVIVFSLAIGCALRLLSPIRAALAGLGCAA